VVGLFAGALVLGEPVGLREVAALVLVLGGLAILVGGLSPGRAESPARPAPVSSERREPG
jgi:hypothetical protein